MLVIELFKDRDLKFAPFIHSLIGECAKFYRVGDRPVSVPDNSTIFGVPKRRFLRLLEIWAMKQYQMFIRFNFIEGNVVNTIEVGWENFNEEEIEYVVMNMYPKETNNEATR